MTARKGTEEKTRRKRRRWLRVLAVLLVLAGVLAITAHFALPRVVSHVVRSQLEEIAESADRDIEFDQLELVKLHQYNLYNVRVTDPGDHETIFFEADRIGVRLDRSHLFAGNVIIRSIEVDQPAFTFREFDDGTNNYDELLEPLLEDLGLIEVEPDLPDSDGTGQAADPEPKRERGPDLFALGVPQVSITGAHFDFSDTSLESVPQHLRDMEVSVEPLGDGFDVRFSVTSAIEGMPAGPFTRAPTFVSIAGDVAPRDESISIDVGFGEPLELDEVPGLRDLVMRFQGVGYEHPNTLVVKDIDLLDGRTRARVLNIPELEVGVRSLELDLEKLELDLVAATGIRAYVEIDRQGRSNIARLLGLEGAGPLMHILPEHQRQALEEDANQDETPQTPPTPDETTPTPVQTASSGGFCHNKDWWECFPQTLELHDINMEVIVHDDGQVLRTVDLHIPSFMAGKRLLNFQMDATTGFTMTERGEGLVGSATLDVIYYWMSERWRVELGLESVDLGRFYEVSPYRNMFNLVSGILDGAITVADDRPSGGDLRVGTDRTSADLGVFWRVLGGEEVWAARLRYGFTAALDRDNNFTMSDSRFELNEIQGDVRVEFTELGLPIALDYLAGFTRSEHDDDYWEARAGLAPPFTSATLSVNLPSQPAMEVFESVPETLRTAMAGTEMEGHVAWRFEAVANYSREDDGRLAVEIPPPTEADVIDTDLVLTSLPPDIDVRRLIEGFSFLFIDGIGERRQLVIGIENPRWVTLDLISPMMIESILNTEDQSFFESDGFNWYQMRRVIGDLLAEQELGRGASTITMQLVKNVFLSRERVISRKVAEVFLTYWMTKLIPKERIIEVYLNVIEFGPGINGIVEAAEYYFGKLPADLTLGECTFLVSIVPNPREYHILYEQGEIPDRWWRHMQRYMDRMLAREVITQEQYDEATRAKPDFYIRGEGDPALRPIEPDFPFIPIFDDLFEEDGI